MPRGQNLVLHVNNKENRPGVYVHLRANRADPDQTPHPAMSDQDLHCLLNTQDVLIDFFLGGEGDEKYHPTPLKLEMVTSY